ncbi:MAG: ABC1 kinase family protein [Sandaracinaceae bacterium]
MAKDKERVPGRLARTLRTAWLGGRVGGSYLGGRVADAFRGRAAREGASADRHEANARRIVRTMEQLRGPLMKIGQMLSTHAEALPVEYGELLRPLQASVPPMSFGTIREVLEADLGEKPEQLFAELSTQAVAAASLGQVHRGRLKDGTDVAVKVQYPGATSSVEGDVSNIHLGAKLVKRVFSDALGQTRFDMTPIAEELAEHLAQETDYCREAYNARLLGELFEGDAQVLVPRVHLSHSGLRVVTYDWVDGAPLDAALESADPEGRERIVRQLLHALWHQLFHGGLLHADPHPGNFRVAPDGRLGILDYGCVKVFDEAFLRAFASMMKASLEEDDEALRETFVALELMDDPTRDDEFEDMQRIAGYFSVGMREDAPFDFGAFDYVGAARELVTHFLRRRRPPPAQRQFLFLTRVVLGYYEYFSRARAHLNFRRVVTPYLERGYEGRRIAIPPYG